MHLILNPDIQDMLVNFYAISGLRVGLHDEKMNIITEYPVKSQLYDDLRFCDKVRFHSPMFTQMCYDCDMQAYNRVSRTGKTYIYTCHGGFLEAIVPIMVDNVILCCFMIGQVRRAADCRQVQQLVQCVESEIELTAEMEEAYAAMPVMSLEKFTAFVYFLETCASHIYEKRFIRLQGKDLIEKFQRYVEEHIHESMSVNQVAAALHVSASHLARVIAGDMQTTFSDYLNHARIKVAKDMLLSTDLSVAEVAERLAYNDPTYFMRVFKRITGMTCTEFKKTLV